MTFSENQSRNPNFEKIKEIDEIREIAIYLMDKFDVADYAVASSLASSIKKMGYSSVSIKNGIVSIDTIKNLLSEYVFSKKEIEHEKENEEYTNVNQKTLVKTLDTKMID